MVCSGAVILGNGDLLSWNINPFSTATSRGRIEVSCILSSAAQLMKTRNSGNESLMSGTATVAAAPDA